MNRKFRVNDFFFISREGGEIKSDQTVFRFEEKILEVVFLIDFKQNCWVRVKDFLFFLFCSFFFDVWDDHAKFRFDGNL